MARKLTQQDKDAVLAIRHLPRREVASRTGLSIGAIQGIISEAEKDLPGNNSPAPPGEGPEVALSTPAEVISFAESAARQAAAQGNVAAMIGAGRLASAAVVEQRKAEPPPVVDVNVLPAMADAARRCREELHKGLDRIAAEIAALGSK